MTIAEKREALKERFAKYPLIDLSGENKLNDPAYQAHIIDNATDEAIDKVCQLIDAVDGLLEMAYKKAMKKASAEKDIIKTLGQEATTHD